MLRRISRVGIDEADSDDTNSSIESEQCSNQEEEEQIQDVEEEMVQEEKVDVVKLDTKLVLTSDEFPTIVGTPYESGPVMDINHLGVVEMEYHRRSKAVELIRTYLKYKSLPGHEIRTKRERNMKSIFSKFARGYLRICPCVRPKMSDAVWDGDIILVHSLVGFESFDARSPEGETLLSIAIQQKRDQIAKFLLKRGADFDLEDYNTKKTPLVHAVIMGNKSLAYVFLLLVFIFTKFLDANSSNSVPINPPRTVINSPHFYGLPFAAISKF